jgi:hypothetical protein
MIALVVVWNLLVPRWIVPTRKRRGFRLATSDSQQGCSLLDRDGGVCWRWKQERNLAEKVAVKTYSAMSIVQL